MSNKNSEPQEEEVDLGNLFQVIGKGIKEFFNFLGNIVNQLFHYVILLLVFLRKHAILLGIAIIIGGGLGFVLEKFQPKKFTALMIVETNYDSGIHLYKQINFLNELVKREDTKALSEILAIDEANASELNEFEVKVHEPNKQIYKAFDRFIQSTDTVYIKDYKFSDFKKRFTNYDYPFHEIIVKSNFESGFQVLTDPIIELIENDYYKERKALKIEEIKYKKEILNNNLSQIDSLRKTYREVALNNSKSNIKTSATLEIVPKKENNFENDIELFNTSDQILEHISNLNDELLISKNTVNVISNFNDVGVVDREITSKKYFQIAILFGTLMLLLILLKNLNKFLKNYN